MGIRKIKLQILHKEMLTNIFVQKRHKGQNRCKYTHPVTETAKTIKTNRVHLFRSPITKACISRMHKIQNSSRLKRGSF